MAKEKKSKREAKKPSSVAKTVKKRKSLLLDRSLIRASKETMQALDKIKTLGSSDGADDDYGSDSIAEQIASMTPEALVARLDRALIGTTLRREQDSAKKTLDSAESSDLPAEDMRAVDVMSNFRVRKKMREKFARRLNKAQGIFRDHLIFKVIPIALAFENAAEDAQTALRDLGQQPDAAISVNAPRMVLRTMMNESLVAVICDQLKIPREHGIELLGELRSRNKEPHGKGNTTPPAQRESGKPARSQTGLSRPNAINASSIRRQRV